MNIISAKSWSLHKKNFVDVLVTELSVVPPPVTRGIDASLKDRGVACD